MMVVVRGKDEPIESYLSRLHIRIKELEQEGVLARNELRAVRKMYARESAESVEYARNIVDAANLLISCLTDPRADHSHYMDEVRMLQKAISRLPHLMVEPAPSGEGQ